MRKFSFVFIALLALPLLPEAAGAAEYVQKQRVYSFQYPDDWAINTEPKSGMIVMGPLAEEGAVMCHSIALESPGTKDADAQAMVDKHLQDNVAVKAIQSADPSAKNLDAVKLQTANAWGERVTYDAGGGTPENPLRKVSQLLAFNTISGHTVDMTCFTTAEKWEAYSGKFEEIQKSLTMMKGDGSLLPELPDFIGEENDIVTQNMQIARDNLTKAKMPNGEFVPAETEEELKAPIIPVEDGRRVVNQAILTAMAEYCALNWQQGSFIPFMETERKKDVWSGKQIAYIGLLHGLTQGSFLRLFAEGQEGCPADLRAKTQSLLAPIPAKAGEDIAKP